MLNNQFHTYTLPRPFFGMSIPIPIQSAYLREYASRNSLSFRLPVTEVCFGNSYYSLANIFREMVKNEDFGAVSIFCLPILEIATLTELLNLLQGKNIQLHFPLESFRGSTETLYSWRKNFLTVQKYSCKTKSYDYYLRLKR